ncbi:hypothetical protein [Actinoplanes sp. RD1]|uniref:hypothetical protein n=1 Tax=Actinoplanes sp. RD1 TaxID=3064538 RepID=UPI002740B73F|nr:hypothetical protein [Actinoplanes sp. RD1]
MTYEDDGSVAYVPVKVYDNGLAVPSGTTFYGDREQTQAYVDCLNAKAKAQGDATRYRVGGLAPLPDVSIDRNYVGPLHSLEDGCTEQTA